MTDDVVPHTPYQGLVQIFNYNRPFYLRTAAVAIAAILLSNYLPPVLRLVILLATGIASFWICSSLVVSHYIYDRSDLCRMRWLPGCLSQAPERWMSIHAGINESSLAIGSIFSGSKGQVIDIYDPRKMTEPSIKRARHVTSLSSPAADLHCLPAPDDNFDAVFLIFTAHELRRHKDRLELFREIARGATKRRRIGPGRTRPRLGQLSCIRPGLSSFLLETHLGNRCKLSCAPDKAAYDRHTVCSRVRIAKISMNIYLAMKIAGALLLTLGLAHGFFYRIFEWKKELGQLSVLTRQMFLVHCFFISLSVTLIGACTLFYTDALLRSGTLSRVVLAGFALFWLVRAAFQFFVYDSAIWRGRRFYTFMHVVFSTFWTYLVLVYGAALRVACTYEYYSPTQIRN